MGQRARRRRPDRQHLIEALAAVSGLLGVVLGFGTNIGTDLIAEDSFLRTHDGVVWGSIAVVAILVVVVLWAQQRLARRTGSTGDASRMVRDIPALPALSAAVRLALPSAHKSICDLPLRDVTFTGRAAIIDDMRAHVRAHPGTLLVLTGLGGVGKTSIALEYGHRAFAAREYRLVWWIRAETSVTIAEDLGRLARFLGVEAADGSAVADGLRTALAEHGSWLLVFDNAESADAVEPWLPHGLGQVIVTSRRSAWGSRGRQLTIGEFGMPEAIGYLNARVGRDESDDARRLAAVLGCLPLALAQAGAYVEAHGRLPLRDYFQLYSDREKAGQLLAARIPGYPHSVATTWLIHFEELAKRRPAALELLRLCAHLDPDRIDLSVISSRLSDFGSHPTRALAHADGALQIEAGELVATSLVTWIGSGRIRMHRLVAQVTRQHIADPPARWQRVLGVGRVRARRWRKRAVAILAAAFPKWAHRPENWSACAELAPHAVAALDGAADDRDAADLQMRFGSYLVSQGRFLAGRRLLETAVRIYRKVEPDGVASVLARFHLGVAQYKTGQADHAWENLAELTEDYERYYGRDHPEYPVLVENLARVSDAVGRHAAAGELRRRLREPTPPVV